MPVIPYVTERDARGERTSDVYSRLLRDRIVFLGTPVEDSVANAIIAQLLFLDADQPGRDIFLYINSPGGSVSAGLAIYDTMQFISSPVHTICMGLAASMGAFLLAAGAKGKRIALPNARIMIHQPSGGARGTAEDIAIEAQEILSLRARLNEIMGEHTGKSVDQLAADMTRDRWMTATAARDYGIVDHVLKNRHDVAKAFAPKT